MLTKPFLFGLPALVLFHAFGSTLTASAQSLPACEPVGRIANGSSQNYRRGQVVCSGAEIREPNEVQFLCFINGIVVPLTGQSVTVTSNTCSIESTAVGAPTVQTCDRTGLGRILCFISKGPDEQFQVIAPETISSNPRPTISWESIADAESYTVSVIGPNMSWNTVVAAEHTELTYPEAEPSLAAGNAYEVLIIANRPQEPMVASRVVNIRTDGSEVISLGLTRMEPSRTDG